MRSLVLLLARGAARQWLTQRASQLTLRSWVHSEENKRRTLQRSDIATAVQRTDILDFLVDIMPAVDQPGAGEADGGAAEGAEDEEEEG